jgi:hypothetical protein
MQVVAPLWQCLKCSKLFKNIKYIIKFSLTTCLIVLLTTALVIKTSDIKMILFWCRNYFMRVSTYGRTSYLSFGTGSTLMHEQLTVLYPLFFAYAWPANTNLTWHDLYIHMCPLPSLA